MRQPKRFLRLSNPQASVDRRNLAVLVETEDGTNLDIEIPLTEVGALIEFLVAAASRVNPEAPCGQASWDPIPLHGLGFGAGRSPAETLLVVRFGGFDLAFALDSSRLKELAHDFAHILQTLAAPTDLSH